jgi:hypothetical protein
VLEALLAEDVARLVGPKGRHNPDRAAVRHGSEPGQVTLGGRRVRVRRPRVRTADGTGEVAVRNGPSFLPLGGVDRPRRAVRFARLLQRRGRVLGGPAARAASGGSLSLAWLPRSVEGRTRPQVHRAGKRAVGWRRLGRQVRCRATMASAAPDGGCGRSHSDAIVGCIVWSTTASSSALSASRSTCSRSRAANASTVRAAS